MIDWIAVDEKWPPIDEKVLTFKQDRDWIKIESNMLSEGDGVAGQNGIVKQKTGLFYWENGDVFEEITHWAMLPNLPPNAMVTSPRVGDFGKNTELNH